MQHYLQMLPETGNCRHIGVRGKIIFFHSSYTDNQEGAKAHYFQARKNIISRASRVSRQARNTIPIIFFIKMFLKRQKETPKELGVFGSPPLADNFNRIKSDKYGNKRQIQP